MKTLCMATVISVCFLAGIIETDAQINQTKLNQTELMKQFLGNWKCELSKNTSYLYEFRPFGDGMICNAQVIIDVEIADSVKQLYGYDSITDKFIVAELIKSSSEIKLSSGWFTSEQSGKIVSTDPDQSEIKIDFEFQSPDIIKQTAVLGINYIVEMTLNRIKD